MEKHNTPDKWSPDLHQCKQACKAEQTLGRPNSLSRYPDIITKEGFWGPNSLIYTPSHSFRHLFLSLQCIWRPWQYLRTFQRGCLQSQDQSPISPRMPTSPQRVDGMGQRWCLFSTTEWINELPGIEVRIYPKSWPTGNKCDIPIETRF